MSRLQGNRANIIHDMMSKISEIREAKGLDEKTFPLEDEMAVARLTMLKYGCTREKVKEYLDLIFGRGF